MESSRANADSARKRNNKLTQKDTNEHFIDFGKIPDISSVTPKTTQKENIDPFLEFGKVLPSTALANSPMKEVNDSLADLGKSSNLSVPVSQAETRPGGKNSRFAGFANAKVAHLKRVHDTLAQICDDEAAQNEEGLPEFLQMDLSRIVNRVLVQLNLQPGPEFLSTTPIEVDIDQLNYKIQIQEEIISDLGKKIEYFSNYNRELVQYNKKLIKERKIALESRDELHSLLDQLRSEFKVAESTPARRRTRNRTFFANVDIIDKAFKEFQSNDIKKLNSDVSNEKGTPECEPKEDPKTESDPILVTAKMISIRKDIDYPAQISVQVDAQEGVFQNMRKNPYRNVQMGLPRKIKISNYHPSNVKDLTKKVETVLGELTANSLSRNREIIECRNNQEYVDLLSSRLNEFKSLFAQCLDALADEQRLTRSWKLKFEQSEDQLDKIKFSRLHVQSEKEKDQIVGAKLLIPQIQPKHVIENLIHHQPTSAKKDYQSNTSIFIPSNL